MSRKSTHPDTTLKLPKILESRGREVEEGGTSKLQYLDHYYHLISHRARSSLSKTAKLTWKDTDSDTLSTGLSWVMSATQEFKGHVTVHSHWEWTNPMCYWKVLHFTDFPRNTVFFLLECCLKLNWLSALHNTCINSNSCSGTLKGCCYVTPTSNDSPKKKKKHLYMY